MKFQSFVRMGVLLLAVAAIAAAADKKEQAKPASRTIDSGSFGVFINGNRVATETFTVQQQNSASVVKSELKANVGVDPVVQKSDLEITGTGELLRYEWSQVSGGSLVVMPNNEFLIEKITTPTSTKPAEQPFLMPNTSAILDNNFFVHREVLAWRFLSGACKSEGGNLKCQQAPSDFGVLVPQDRTSIHVQMELVGKEKVTIRGVERELLRLNLKSDNFQWSLWVDDRDQFKLMRVSIPADNTEVVRD